ncbi:Rqc2 family fibronectin-binding protein [Companilactobacillus sp. DQM5]|uniref:Rqc2 family fibronectin-binding protein n=1 Tax=Companilactobacillus sp. DQM5 TaxID=3463359 RepID=UPI00405A1B70
MSFDGTFTHAMVNELKEKLLGGRISKIQQPFKNELVLTIRSNRKNYPLLLSANPIYSRIQITNIDFSNPDKPSNFVMSMRKNIDGSIITDIKQIGNDRIVVIYLETKDELGYQINFKIIIEIMGRYSNIVLVDNEEKIIDLIKHVSSSKNRFRTLMPSEKYVFPPKTNKKNPFNDFSDDDLKDLQNNFEGLGTDTTRELEFRLNESNIKRVAFRNFFNEINNNIYPNIIIKDNKSNFFPIEFKSFSDSDKKTSYFSLSEMLDVFFREKAQNDRVKSSGENLLLVVNSVLKKDKNKLKRLNKDLKKTENMDKYRIYGELLTTYMNNIKQGMSEIKVNNYYDNSELTIPLDNKLSPSANSQKYFKTYQKLKKSINFINTQIEETNAEINYLESVLYQISESKLDNLQEIKEELIVGGYIKKKNKTKKHKNNKEIGNKFISTSGDLIIVGRNNIQNDQLTLRIAKKNYIWLHVKNIPGSHVVISSNDPDEETLLQAGKLAAYYSKAKNSSNVEVDYVPIKKIKKPNGAKPGFVIYEGQKTLVVTPEVELVEQLKENYLNLNSK